MHPLPALLGGIGPGELVLIFGVMLLVFGPRLPEVGRALGIGIKEFKEGLRDGSKPEEKKEDNDKNDKEGNRLG